MSHGNEMICQPVTLSGYAEWPKVADAVIEALSEAKKWAQITEGAIFEGRHFNLRKQRGIQLLT